MHDYPKYNQHFEMNAPTRPTSVCVYFTVSVLTTELIRLSVRGIMQTNGYSE